MIAAVALARGLPIYTSNPNDFTASTDSPSSPSSPQLTHPSRFRVLCRCHGLGPDARAVPGAVRGLDRRSQMSTKRGLRAPIAALPLTEWGGRSMRTADRSEGVGGARRGLAVADNAGHDDEATGA